MNTYLLVYRGAVQPENGQQHMADWMAWVKDLGDAMVDPGIPVLPSKTITASGISDTRSDNPISGISIIKAVDLEAAMALIRPCPHLRIGGGIEVAEAMNLPMA
ncbi:hypothetical protein ACFODZ_01355 [Marinicella sediminis]|uniref:YCII-related domain-containing protein n=1 Tax=Marinicella sediminis TaxID=1792834 RepID=A0ABV7J9T6_9GAMM|nr:hypothetical protein [Marinicella sediminis]